MLYKTLARDMRKYYSKDFNSLTKFILFKRYKEKDYYITCIKDYFKQKFPEFETFLDQDYRCPSLNFEADSNDLIFFIGCLLYPKELWVSIQNINNDNNNI